MGMYRFLLCILLSLPAVAGEKANFAMRLNGKEFGPLEVELVDYFKKSNQFYFKINAVGSSFEINARDVLKNKLSKKDLEVLRRFASEKRADDEDMVAKRIKAAADAQEKKRQAAEDYRKRIQALQEEKRQLAEKESQVNRTTEKTLYPVRYYDTVLGWSNKSDALNYIRSVNISKRLQRHDKDTTTKETIARYRNRAVRVNPTIYLIRYEGDLVLVKSQGRELWCLTEKLTEDRRRYDDPYYRRSGTMYEIRR